MTNGVLLLSNTLVVLDGLTIQNGSYGAGAGILVYKAGLITNCVVRHNVAYVSDSSGHGGGIYVNADTGDLGVLTHSQIVSNRAHVYAGGVYMGAGSKGLIQYCTVASNYASRSDVVNGGGGLSLFGPSTFAVAAVTVRCCTIAFNTALSCGGGLQLTRNGGLVDRCLIVSNYQSSASASRLGSGVYFYLARDGAIVRNSLIAFNSNNNYLAVAMGGGRIENCTVVNNRKRGISHSSDVSYGTGVVVNTIIYSNAVTNVDATVTTLTNCCVPYEIPGEGHITGYPSFFNPQGDFRLKPDSPCLNAGLPLPWMNTAVDYDGQRRVDAVFGRVDIGAYEFLPAASLFRLK